MEYRPDSSLPAHKSSVSEVSHTPATRGGRLRRSDPRLPGYSRAPDQRGFAYFDPSGAPISDAGTLARIHALAIPPAWRDVWISPDPLGHLQAIGVDAAGRHQYLYHELWQEQEDRLKFEHMERFARTLPGMRESLLGTMGGGHELDRARVLACAIRLLDVGMFRIGSDVYEKEDGHLGLSTLAKTNVSIAADGVVFDYVAKEGVHQVHTVRDRTCVEIVSALKHRRGGGPHLLAFREAGLWHAVHAHLINEYLKDLIGGSFSAKNFRTWNGTLLAAVSVARQGGEADTRASAPPGDQRGDQGGRAGAREHAGGGTLLLHRSARVRPVPLGLDDRERPGGGRRARAERGEATRGGRGRRTRPHRLVPGGPPQTRATSHALRTWKLLAPKPARSHKLAECRRPHMIRATERRPDGRGAQGYAIAPDCGVG